MYTALYFYVALSSFSVLISGRVVGVSVHSRRLPRLMEILRTPPQLKHLKAIRAARLFVWCWIGLFFFAWLRGVTLASDERQMIRGFFGITVLNLGVVLNTLLAVKFNLNFRDKADKVLDQNHLYLDKVDLFPGFKQPLDAFISVCSAMLTLAILVALAVTIIPSD